MTTERGRNRGEAVHTDPRPRHSRLRLRGVLGDGRDLRGPEALEQGQAGSLRMRHRANPDPVGRRQDSGQLLRDRDAVHRLRHRDRVPLPWAVTFNKLGPFGLVEMVTFVVTVLIAYTY